VQPLSVLLFFIERVLVLEKHGVRFSSLLIFVILTVLVIYSEVVIILLHDRSHTLATIYLFDLSWVIIEVLLQMIGTPSNKIDVGNRMSLISDEILNLFTR
jgi:hypothetical protein